MKTNKKLNKDCGNCHQDHKGQTICGDGKFLGKLNQPLNNEKWEEEYDREFGRGGFGDTKIFIQLKQFIFQLLKEQRNRVLEEVMEGLDKHDIKESIENMLKDK